ncbi:MAG: hypothetical protein WDW20_00915 [Neisseriaceae bacterium]
MQQPNKKKVVLLHGLYCNGWIMAFLAYQLRKRGYLVISPSYSTVKQWIGDGAKELEQKVRSFKAADPVYFVGHSMGGLMLRYLREFFPDLFVESRVVTLGTPHRGSQFAQTIQGYFPWMLGSSWERSLNGEVPLWDGEIPLLSIAGTMSNIENLLLRVFPKGEKNDSLVALVETQMPQFRATKSIHLSHLPLCFSQQVVEWVDNWFQGIETDFDLVGPMQ